MQEFALDFLTKESLSQTLQKLSVDPEDLDVNGVPRQLLIGLCRLGLVNQFVDNSLEAFERLEELTSCSGLLAFLWLQHIAAIRAMKEFGRGSLSEPFVRGDRLCGIAMAQLTLTPCPVRATQVGREWRLNGRAAWYSGWGLFDEIVVGAYDLEERPLLLKVAARNPAIVASPPLQLCAMEASQTVSLEFHDCVGEKIGLWRPAADPSIDLRDCALPLGICRAVCDRLGKRGPHASLNKLREDYRALRYRAEKWPLENLKAAELRADCLYMALRASQILLVVGGGFGNLKHQAPQRLLREAAFFAMIAGKPNLMLERLGALEA